VDFEPMEDLNAICGRRSSAARAARPETKTHGNEAKAARAWTK